MEFSFNSKANTEFDFKLVLVTSTNPTPYGEGKTTMSIGINDALHQVKEQQTSVAFFEREGRVVMFSLKDELV